MNLELIHAIEKMANVKIHIEGEKLYVDGRLDLSGCTRLTELPENLHVDGRLDLEGCTNLTALPDNLHVDGGLYLCGCTGLTELPKNLYVNGCLSIYCPNLKSNEHYIISEEMGIDSSKAIYKISTGTVKCDCFTGNLLDFEDQVCDECSSGEYREQYDKYIYLCRSINSIIVNLRKGSVFTPERLG